MLSPLCNDCSYRFVQLTCPKCSWQSISKNNINIECSWHEGILFNHLRLRKSTCQFREAKMAFSGTFPSQLWVVMFMILPCASQVLTVRWCNRNIFPIWALGRYRRLVLLGEQPRFPFWYCQRGSFAVLAVSICHNIFLVGVVRCLPGVFDATTAAAHCLQLGNHARIFWMLNPLQCIRWACHQWMQWLDYS